MSIQSIQADLNDAQATLAKLESPNPFWGLSDAEATLKLSRLLLPLDRELSDRYAKLAEQAAENERSFKEKKELKGLEIKSQREAKVASLLPLVAADFANLDPNDQESWDAVRAKWVSQEPGLSSYVPEKADQNAWDRIQTQGGKSSNVAPKGEYATRKEVEKKIGLLSTLAMQARGSGKNAEADMLTSQALDLQKSLNATPSSDGKETPDAVVNRYANDISNLEKMVTRTSVPGKERDALFATISKDIGEGSVLTAVKAAINKRLEDKMSSVSKSIEISEADLKKLADDQKTQATNLSATKRKIVAAKELLRKGIKNGAAAISAKALQDDVLADAEFARYGSESPFAQWFNRAKSAIGLNQSVPLQTVVDLTNSLIEVYNQAVADYVNQVGADNKYRDKSVAPVPEWTNPAPGTNTNKGPKKGDTKKVGNIEMIYNGTGWVRKQ